MQDGSTIHVVKAQTDVDTQTTGSTNRGKAKPNTVSKEVVQGSSKKLHALSPTGNELTSNPHSDVFETMNQTQSTVQTDGQPTQAHLPVSASKEGSTRNDTASLENVFKSDIQPENPTAPPAVSDAETARAEPDLIVITPTLQSGETLNNRVVVVETSNISAGGIKEKETDDRLETVLPKTDTAPQRQHPSEKKEGGRETDEYETHLKVDEEVERDIKMKKGSNDDDTEELNPSSLDRLSQLSTVNSETNGAKLRPGIRGQRVRHC